MTKRVVIGYHGHCFDGMCSSAILTRFLGTFEADELNFTYRGLDHQAGGSFVPEALLDGDINVVVDFRYTTSPRLHWWFDHHISGIVGETERRHFEQDRSGRKFFNPDYSSCTKLIVDVARNRFKIDLSDLADLVHWADIIDSAQFENAKTAVELELPVLQLMTVIEAHGDEQFLSPVIAKLARGMALNQLALDSKVQALFQPLREAHEKTRLAIRGKAEFKEGVVMSDLSDLGIDRFNKFIPYLYYPQALYSVTVLASPARAKVSVGSNPWIRERRGHNIAQICAQYGGGGHPAVGAVALNPDQVERARQIGKAIAEELRREKA